MNKYYIAALAIVVVGLLSCKGNKHSETDTNISFENCQTIKLNPEGGRKIELTAIAKEINVIPLETTDEAVISYISKIEYDDGLYFVQDENSKQVFVFDSLGNYRNKIWRQGRGPGEVLYPNNFALSKADKTVWVTDNAETVKKYSYSGEYQGSIPWGIFVDDFYINDNGSVYCYTAKSTNWKDDTGQDYWCDELTIIDRNDEKHRYIPVDTTLYSREGRLTIDVNVPFSVLRESVTFHHTISDVIYSIDRRTDEVTAKYKVDYSGKEYKTDLATIETMEAFDYIVAHPEEAGLIRNVVESEEFLTLTYFFMGEVYQAIYNKRDNSIIEGVLENDLFGAPVRFGYQRDGVFVSAVMGLSNSAITDKAKGVLSQEMIEKLNKDMDESANPILIEIKM